MKSFQQSIILFFILLPCVIIAQKNIKFTYKDKKLDVGSFKETSVPDSINPARKVNLLPPIIQSPAVFEIRQYFPMWWNSTREINSISFYKDSCIKTHYFCWRKTFPPDDLWIKKEGYIIQGDYLIKITRTKLPDTLAYAILDSLQKVHFFSLGDQTHLLDSLKSKGIQVHNPCYRLKDCWPKPTFYEVKINNLYKNFNREDPRYFEYNPTIVEFKDNLMVAMLFYENKS